MYKSDVNSFFLWILKAVLYAVFACSSWPLLVVVVSHKELVYYKEMVLLTTSVQTVICPEHDMPPHTLLRSTSILLLMRNTVNKGYEGS